MRLRARISKGEIRKNIPIEPEKVQEKIIFLNIEQENSQSRESSNQS